ncbi:hypothetical protein JCM8097_000881 [Rhodosporidiobolus ruineniae]
MATPRSLSSATPPGSNKASQAAGRRAGRKSEQQDLNHLLGFTLPPRAPQPTLTHLPRRSNNRSSNKSGSSSGWGGAFDRSRFVHTFRFIVKPDKDYTAHFADPDLHLDWADILQVILPTSSSALSMVSGARIDQASESGKPACPICLSEPTAARMTKCGHVFCYPCVLHYLALADPGIKFRKCPVCHDSIYAKELKSVKWFDPAKDVTGPSTSSSSRPSPPPAPASSDPIDADIARALELSRLDAHPPSAHASSSSSGERLTLRLLRRPQLTTLALPRSSTWPSEAVPPLRAPWQFTPDALTFAKFMLGEPSYMRDELLSQRRELEDELKMLRRMGGSGTDEQLGTVFVEEAMRKVDEQAEMVELMKTTPVMTARKKARRELEELLEGEENGEVQEEQPVAVPLVALGPVVDEPVPLEFLSARSASASGTSTPTAAGLSSSAVPFAPSFGTSSALPPPVPFSTSPPKRTPHHKRNVLPATPSEATEPTSDSYYFYQSLSGHPIFLTPLDIRILKSHFGTYANLPDKITVTVEGADEGSMNDDLRRRCKWLAHLPRGSDVVFVEADLSSVVPRRALEPFQSALKARRTKRKDKARKEENARKRAEVKAREEMPVYHSTWENGRDSDGVPLSFASASSWEDTHAFPAPPSAPRSASASAVSSSPPGQSSSSARPSFAAALHASSRSHSGWGGDSYAHDYDYDDRWDDFEEQLGRARASTPRGGGGGGGGGGSTPPAQSGPGNVNLTEGGGQGKKGKKGRKGGITLSLTGGMRTGG